MTNQPPPYPAWADRLADGAREAEMARRPSIEALIGEAEDNAGKLGALLSQLEDRLTSIRRPTDDDGPTQIPADPDPTAPLVTNLERHNSQLRALQRRVSVLNETVQL